MKHKTKGSVYLTITKESGPSYDSSEPCVKNTSVVNLKLSSNNAIYC